MAERDDPVCPHCGRCRHCGQPKPPGAPYWVIPAPLVPWYWPWSGTVVSGDQLPANGDTISWKVTS